MTFATNILAAFGGVAADIKALKLADGDLSSLPTSAKNNLVASIVELHGLIPTASASIDDAAGDGAIDRTWSADKIFDEIAAAVAAVKSELRDGAGAAIDTFKELETLMAADATLSSALATAVNNRLRFDEAQALTTPQRLQACQNIGVGDPETDFLAAYVAAKA